MLSSLSEGEVAGMLAGFDAIEARLKEASAQEGAPAR